MDAAVSRDSSLIGCELTNEVRADDDAICALCTEHQNEGLTTLIPLHDDHVFHQSCINEYIQSSWFDDPTSSNCLLERRALKCPLCREGVVTNLPIAPRMFQDEVWPQLFVAFGSRRPSYDTFDVQVKDAEFVVQHYNLIYFNERWPAQDRRSPDSNHHRPWKSLRGLWNLWDTYLRSHHENPASNAHLDEIMQQIHPFRHKDNQLREEYFRERMVATWRSQAPSRNQHHGYNSEELPIFFPDIEEIDLTGEDQGDVNVAVETQVDNENHDNRMIDLTQDDDPMMIDANNFIDLTLDEELQARAGPGRTRSSEVGAIPGFQVSNQASAWHIDRSRSPARFLLLDPRSARLSELHFIHGPRSRSIASQVLITKSMESGMLQARSAVEFEASILPNFKRFCREERRRPYFRVSFTPTGREPSDDARFISQHPWEALHVLNAVQVPLVGRSTTTRDIIVIVCWAANEQETWHFTLEGLIRAYDRDGSGRVAQRLRNWCNHHQVPMLI